MIRWKKQSSIVLAVSVVIAVLVLSQMGMYEAHLLWGANLHRNLFDFCVGLFYANSFSYYLITFFLNMVIAFTVLTMIVKGMQQYCLIRKFRRKLLALTNDRLTESTVLKFNRLNKDIIVINHNDLVALTMGFRKPRIVLSTGLIYMLDEQELLAVIEHESSHLVNRDALKIFVLQLISQALWFIPLTRWSYQNYKIMSELSADEFAIRRMGSEFGLGSAMLKMIRNGFKGDAAPVLVHFADGSINYRLRQLVEPQPSFPVKLDTKSLIISVQMLLLLMGMIMLVGT